ncbi:MAG: FAD-dependent oxidoreductase [Flavobacteriaceae bacterium]|jgi:gamma-glutamylputrescine oxidase|nr:FAD-binding oxidoreductase [Flavobacteriaceae bacterium]MDA7728351.1 FAD-binding oxidoreductase [Flavobacteriaceae bacterium]MDA7849443.1 FAD-binding oxidoreductase [Flavobacteriaceae bacterium]MDG1309392.1 FAD-dependent oxidoreductase [Flavobacteriaceae bacterium]|tara:strand:+ start:3337 stop:4449 length:1113 start_codon:yes stop_codon:yes gene_type:complete
MNLSYWELKTWLNNVDYTIVGSGIVGLSTALHLKKKAPNAKIVILEKGLFPQGASTKNAGFACFGSLSEILQDLQSHTTEEVVELVNQRQKGLQLLRHTLGDEALSYQQLGGYELFLEKDSSLYDNCLQKMKEVNSLLKPIFKDAVFSNVPNSFDFKGVQNNYIRNQFEGQIDTGKMMQELIKKVQKQGVIILNNSTVETYTEQFNNVAIKTNHFEFSSAKLILTTNGFAQQLINEDVQPARAQALITKPIKNLNIKGTFHLDCGYYYFRNIDNRILLGGGRNLDFDSENTTEFSQTDRIQNALETLLKNTILSNREFEIEHRWSGIMGVGSQKKPIVKQLSNHVYCGVRMGGMGIAIGSTIGREVADFF